LQENIHPHVMLTFKFLIALPLVYHTLAGIRHLTWDTGKGLKLPVLYKTGYSLIALTFLASFALASIH
jgi:succinate dehydrogenase (ubiquinone) cytochrome b560 subunit